MEKHMNELLKKYNEYSRLIGCRAIYKLENKEEIRVDYREENFLHLLGLHKLTDLQLIQFWLDRSNKTVKLKDVIRKIKTETFTDVHIKESVKFTYIKERYESFSYDNLTTLNYTDAVIDFNASIIHSSLNSDYILFEERPRAEYNCMGIALDNNTNIRYIETFFHETTEKYFMNQNIMKVCSFCLEDVNGNVIVEDIFDA